MLCQTDVVNKLSVEVIKLHQLQYLRGSRLGSAYMASPERFHVLQVEEYVMLIADYVERLSPTIAIERFVSQSPAG